MRAVPFLVDLVRRLAVSEAVMDAAARASEEAGSREPDAARRLYREWLNDTVASPEAARSAALDPDATFLGWALSRVADPFQVPVRAHDAIRAEQGDETALLFAEVRWRQEVAWARRMRGSDNDRIAVLAEMWLTAVRRDVAKLYRGLVEVYAREALTEPGYAESVFHLLAEDEIQEGRVDDSHWRPLWLRFAEREFGRILNGMPRGQVPQLAARCREGEARDRSARRRRGQALALRSRRPALMIAVLTRASESGLSSDDLVGAEADFLRSVEDGSVDLSDRPHDPAWRIFLETMHRWAGRVDAPDAEEACRRVEAMGRLPPDWAAALPMAFRDIGADDQRVLVAWFDAVTGGRRTAPRDPAVDFGMWLVEGISRMR